MINYERHFYDAISANHTMEPSNNDIKENINSREEKSKGRPKEKSKERPKEKSKRHVMNILSIKYSIRFVLIIKHC